MPKLGSETAPNNAIADPLSVHGATQAASSPSNAGQESELSELNEIMKEELRDKSKNLELYRSKIYGGELKNIELQRENQGLRHKVT